MTRRTFPVSLRSMIDRTGASRSSRLLADLLLPVLVLPVYVRHLAVTGLADLVLFEAADSAGDMLQVRKGLETGWFVTGHHSDVGVNHPGPFALWLKAGVSFAHGIGLGGSVYALAMAFFLGVRLATLSLVAWVFSHVAKSRIVGWAGALGVALALTREGTITGLDLQGATIHFLAPWAVLLMFSGALMLLRSGASLLPLTLGAGACAHLHTPVFPLGVLGLLVSAVMLLRREALGRRERVVALSLWAVFVVPLVTRVFLEPGFPFNYVAAARQRTEIAASNTGRTPLEGLATVLDFPQPVLVLLLLTPVVLGAVLWRRSRAATIVLLAGPMWAAVVLGVSPRQERVATELVWIAGVVLFSAAFIGAAAALLLLRSVVTLTDTGNRARRVTGNVATITVGSLALLACVTTLGGVLPTRISTSGGGDGRHVPVMVDAATRWTEGRKFALVLGEPGWFSTSSGVLLALERSGEEFCVAANVAQTSDVATFVPPSRLCPRSGAPLPAVMVTWDADRGLRDLPPGSALTVIGQDGNASATTAHPDELVCMSGGTCFSVVPAGATELARTREPDEGAYGMVTALRMLAFSCSPHEFLPCAELGTPAR